MKLNNELIIVLLVALFALSGMLLTAQLTGEAFFPLFKEGRLSAQLLLGKLQTYVQEESKPIAKYSSSPAPLGCCECGDAKKDDNTKKTCDKLCPAQAKFYEGESCRDVSARQKKEKEEASKIKEKPETIAGVYMKETLEGKMPEQEELPFREYVISGAGKTRGYTKKSPFGPAPPHTAPDYLVRAGIDTGGRGITGTPGEPTVNVATLCPGITRDSKWSCAQFEGIEGCWDSGLIDKSKRYTCKCKPNSAGTYPNCGAATVRFEVTTESAQ